MFGVARRSFIGYSEAGGPRMRVDPRNPFARQLRHLYVPSKHDGSGTRGNPVYEGRNLAGYLDNRHGGAGGANAVIRYGATSSSNKRPPIGRDAFGDYWDHWINGTAGTQPQDITPGGGAPFGWDPAANGGHQPATIFALGRLMRTTSGQVHTIFHLGINGAYTTILSFRMNNTNLQFHVGTGTERTVATPQAALLYQPCLYMGTTRSNTDHELLVRNLVTGALTHVTSVLDSGTTGVAATSIILGSYRGGTTYSLPNQSVWVYAIGMWDRGMTREEMVEFSRNPRRLWVPEEVPNDLFQNDKSFLDLGLSAPQRKFGFGMPPFLTSDGLK